jgi:hypothetical protein
MAGPTSEIYITTSIGYVGSMPSFGLAQLNLAGASCEFAIVRLYFAMLGVFG